MTDVDHTRDLKRELGVWGQQHRADKTAYTETALSLISDCDLGIKRALDHEPEQDDEYEAIAEVFAGTTQRLLSAFEVVSKIPPSPNQARAEAAVSRAIDLMSAAEPLARVVETEQDAHTLTHFLVRARLMLFDAADGLYDGGRKVTDDCTHCDCYRDGSPCCICRKSSDTSQVN